MIYNKASQLTLVFIMLKENKNTGFGKIMLPVLVLIIFSFLTRFLYLGRVPTGITDDELDHVMDAKAIFYTGKGFTGTWTPLFLSPPPHNTTPKGELPGLVIAPIVGSLPTNLFTAHLPFAIFGLALVLLIYLIALRLFNPLLAFIVGLVACFNPTLLILSRSGYETILALFFFFAAFYFLLFAKSKKILLAIPFLFLAFFMYIALKIIFLPLVAIACFYGWWVTNKKKYTKYYLIVFGFSLLLLGWYFYSLKFTVGAGSRTKELLTPFSSFVSQTVDQERRLSANSFLITVFNNKPIVFLRLFVEKYLGVFSTSFLFLFGEGQMSFSLWKHGMFYYLDFFFMLLGCTYLFAKQREKWLFLVGIILLAPIPAAISIVGNEYVNRAGLIYIPLVFFTGAGIYYFLALFRNKKLFYLVVFSMTVVYGLLIGNFLTIYFLRNPVYNSEGSGFSTRVLSSYLKRAVKKNEEVLVVVRKESGFFKHELFYNQLFDKDTIISIQQKYQRQDFPVDGITVKSDCEGVDDMVQDKLVISLAQLDCFEPQVYSHWLSISQLADGGEIFKIYNDRLCKKFDLSMYPHNIRFDHFAVEDLSDEIFCQKFISDLTGYSRLIVTEEK